MYNGELLAALVLGITLSIIFADMLGIIPAGIIVPSFIALVFDQPYILAGMLIIAALAYICVRLLSRYIILYGRRKFGAMILAALFIKMGLLFASRSFMLDYFALQGMGIIVPGLIANSFDRQGIIPTLGSMLLLGGVTYLGVLAYITLL